MFNNFHYYNNNILQKDKVTLLELISLLNFHINSLLVLKCFQPTNYISHVNLSSLAINYYCYCCISFYYT